MAYRNRSRMPHTFFAHGLGSILRFTAKSLTFLRSKMAKHLRDPTRPDHHTVRHVDAEGPGKLARYRTGTTCQKKILRFFAVRTFWSRIILRRAIFHASSTRRSVSSR